MDSVEFIGLPTPEGKFQPESPKALAAFLKAKAAQAKAKGKNMPLRVTIEDWRPTRSNQQNRAWFKLVVQPFCEYMGYRFNVERDRLYVHEQILIAIGHKEESKGFGGEIKERALPTHDLEDRDFWDLYERAQQLGAEHGIIIPDPERAMATV